MRASDVAYIITLLEKDCSTETALIRELQEVYRRTQGRRWGPNLCFAVERDLPSLGVIRVEPS